MAAPQSVIYLVLVPPHEGPVAIMQIINGADKQECLDKFTAVNWKPKSVRQIQPDTIPADRTFRNAWRVRNAHIVHHMPTVRDLHRDRIRAARQPVLEALDLTYIRADESGDPARKTAIAANKQRLRDLPQNPAIETAQTIEEIKTIWPGQLPNPYLPPPPAPPPKETALARLRARLNALRFNPS